MGFSRQEYWSGLPFSSPGDLPHPGRNFTSMPWHQCFFTPSWSTTLRLWVYLVIRPKRKLQMPTLHVHMWRKLTDKGTWGGENIWGGLWRGACLSLQMWMHFIQGSTNLVAQMVKNLPAMRETRVWSLGREDPLEEGMATHSRLLTRRIPWMEEPGGLQCMGSQIVRHDLVTNRHTVKYRPGMTWVMARVWRNDTE